MKKNIEKVFTSFYKQFLGWKKSEYIYLFSMMAILSVAIFLIFYLDNESSYANKWITSIATLFGFLGSLQSVRRNSWNFFWYVISAAMLSYIYFISGIYLNATLLIIFILMYIWGIFHWIQNKSYSENEDYNRKVNVRNIDKKILFLWIIFLTGVTIGMFFLVQLIPGEGKSIPEENKVAFYIFVLMDAFILVFGVFAEFCLVMRYKENWFLWIIINLITASSLLILIILGNEIYLIPSVILSLSLSINAVKGHLEWNKL